MRLTVSVDEMREKLSRLQSIASKKSTMPILGFFLLVAGEENYVIGTDLETALKEPVNFIEVEEGGSICLPTKRFYEAVREMEGELTIQSEDTEWVRIYSGKTSFRLACMSPDEFPRWPQAEEEIEIQMSAMLLHDMLSKTIYAAGESETRYTLNSVLFHLNPPSEIRLVSTDGHRLAVIRTSIEASFEKEIKAIVPRKAASELRSLLQKSEDAVNIRLAQNYMVFYINNIVFLVMLIEGSYPNYEEVIPKENDKIAIVDREGMIKVLRRVSVVSRERQNAVRFDLRPNLLHLSASSPETGEAEDELEVDYSGEEFTLGFNARYLIDAMTAMDEEKVSIEMKEPLSATIVRPVGRDDYITVIMPLRI